MGKYYGFPKPWEHKPPLGKFLFSRRKSASFLDFRR
jgi:hypothetical protein